MQDLYNMFIDKKLKKIIPNSGTCLTFGNNFNQELKQGDISNFVTHLTFGNNFNQELKQGVIPNSVTHLIFGQKFNQELKQEYIPNSVTHLSFGYNFNQELKQGDIPNSVTCLTFGECFNQKLNSTNLPNDLKLLVLYKDILLEEKIKNTVIIQNDVYLNNFIDFTENLKGTIIFEELVKTVFHPNRIHNMSNTYDIEFDDYLDLI